MAVLLGEFGEQVAVIFTNAALSEMDGPGSRVVVFFQGCKSGCAWCHSPHFQPDTAPLLFRPDACILCERCAVACLNEVHIFTNDAHHLNRKHCVLCGKCIEACPHSSENRESSVLYRPTRKISVSALFEQLLPLLSIADGITLSGGEALLQTDAAVLLLKLCKERGVHTAVETSGLLDTVYYNTVAPYVDVWLFGLRVLTSPNGSFHTDQIMTVLDCLQRFSSALILPRIPMIPGVMDKPETLEELLSVIKNIATDKVWLNPWNRFYTHYYDLSGIIPEFPIPAQVDIERCEYSMREFFMQNGYMVTSVQS